MCHDRLGSLVCITLLAGALTVTSCGGADVVPDDVIPSGMVVTVEPARRGPLRHVVTATGRVTPHPDADWTIHATETSLVADLPFEEGAAVDAGEVVVRFEVPSRTSALQAAEFELAQSTARVEAARTRVTDVTALFARGLTARIELDAAKSTLAAAETMLAATQATMSALQAAETRDTVRARFSGVVMERWHYLGDLVMATGHDPVLRLADPTRLQVTLDVPSTQVGTLMSGQRVTLSPLGFAPVTSTVLAILPAATSDGNTYRVLVDLPTDLLEPVHPDTPAITLGTQVFGEVLVAEVLEALVVPTDALRRTGGTSFVFIADAAGRVERRDVRLGVTSAALTQVLDGLEVGDVVITSALNELVVGDAVRYVQ